LKKEADIEAIVERKLREKLDQIKRPHSRGATESHQATTEKTLLQDDKSFEINHPSTTKAASSFASSKLMAHMNPQYGQFFLK